MHRTSAIGAWTSALLDVTAYASGLGCRPSGFSAAERDAERCIARRYAAGPGCRRRLGAARQHSVSIGGVYGVRETHLDRRSTCGPHQRHFDRRRNPTATIAEAVLPRRDGDATL